MSGKRVGEVLERARHPSCDVCLPRRSTKHTQYLPSRIFSVAPQADPLDDRPATIKCAVVSATYSEDHFLRSGSPVDSPRISPPSALMFTPPSLSSDVVNRDLAGMPGHVPQAPPPTPKDFTPETKKPKTFWNDGGGPAEGVPYAPIEPPPPAAPPVEITADGGYLPGSRHHGVLLAPTSGGSGLPTMAPIASGGASGGGGGGRAALSAAANPGPAALERSRPPALDLPTQKPVGKVSVAVELQQPPPALYLETALDDHRGGDGDDDDEALHAWQTNKPPPLTVADVKANLTSAPEEGSPVFEEHSVPVRSCF